MISEKIISRVFSYILVLSLVIGLFIHVPTRVDAADNGRWVFQSSETEYGNTEYYGDVWQFNHEEKNGQIIYKIIRTFSNIDGTFTGLYTTKSDIPPAAINGDQTVSLNVSASVEGTMDNLLCGNSVYLYYHSINSDGTLGYGRKFTKKSTESTSGSSVSVWTGPESNRQYNDKDTVYYKFPAGENDGERMCIELEIGTGSVSNGKNNGGLITHWFYVWRVNSTDNSSNDSNSGNSSTANDANSSEAISGNAEETIDANLKKTSFSKVTSKKKSVTLKWKKQTKGGIKGYEIQCATDKGFTRNIKTVTVNKVKTTSKTIKKLKKGKKYYARIRTFTIKDGKKIYSNWSKTKSIKVK